MPSLSQWLDQNGLSDYVGLLEEQRIDLDVLLELTEADLRELGMPLGDRKRLLRAARALAESSAPDEAHQASTGDAERRQLTVMFCDLVGSTALSRSLDPEDYRDLLREYQTIASEPIVEYGGYVSRYLGDGMLVHFGYPQAHEDDPERAVRAALAVVEAVGGVIEPSGQPLSVRIGIATGPVIVGDIIGEGASEERAVLGDTPNLAARLQGLARPDQVILSQGTRARVEGRFHLEDLGAFDLKGIDEPVTAHRALAVADTSRFEARSIFGLTPLVGRQEEIGILTRRWQLAREGEGQIVLLSGEAGIGKSRLAELVCSRVGDSHPVLRYQCSPFRTNSAFYPIAAQLERAAGFTTEDTPDDKLDKLEALLSSSAEGDAQETTASSNPMDMALMADLLSLPSDRYPALDVTPQKEKLMILDLLVRRLETLSAESALLVMLEDAHWMDPSSLEAFDALAHEVAKLPVLLLITHRPEFEHPWARLGRVTQLSLSTLGTQDVMALVSELTKGKGLPRDLLDEIVEKTDGVPLFVEEFTKTVLESGLLEEQEGSYVRSGDAARIHLPSTLHDSLMARLDRLGQVKEVAQTAAVLGREFEYELIAALSPLAPEVLDQALETLVEVELLGRRGLPPDAHYIFKHALVQDAAYNSLLNATRKQLHERVAVALRERFDEPEPDLLAHHLTEAGQVEPAIEQWKRAAELAARRSANAEAIHHLRRGLALVSGIEEEKVRAATELSLQAPLGAVLAGASGYTDEETIATYRRAHQLSREVEADDSVFHVRYGVWGSLFVAREFDQALELAAETMALAEPHESALPRLVAHNLMGATLAVQGSLDSAARHLRAALELYDPEQHRNMIYQSSEDPRYESLCFLALVEWLRGRPDEAKQCVRGAVDWARELSYAPAIGYTLCHSAIVEILRGDLESAQRLTNEAIDLAQEQALPDWLALADCLMGAIHNGRREWQPGIDAILRGREGWGDNIYASLHLGWLASGYRGAGLGEEAHRTLNKALQDVATTGERAWEAELHRLRGVLAMDEGDLGRARVSFKEAIEVSRRQGSRSFELRAAMSLARALVEENQREQAREVLQPLFLSFDEGFDTADLVAARALLGELG